MTITLKFASFDGEILEYVSASRTNGKELICFASQTLIDMKKPIENIQLIEYKVSKKLWKIHLEDALDTAGKILIEVPVGSIDFISH